jgi:hypothetical protein
MRYLLVLTLAIAAVLAACGDDDSAPSFSLSPSATISATASPTTSPSATPAGLIELTRGADIGFPDDMAFLIETGCWQCDGPPDGLVRFWKNAAGEVVADKLLSYAENSETLVDINGNEIANGRIQGLAATQNASVIVFGVCIQGSCGTGGLDSFEPNSLTAVFRSIDGGVSWHEFGQAGPALYIMAAMGDGRAVAWNVTAELGQPSYLLMPDGEVLTPPAGGVRPVVTEDALLWATADGRLLWPYGDLFADLPYAAENDPYTDPSARGRITAEDKHSVLVHWQVVEDNSSKNYLSPIEGTDVAQPVLRGEELAYLAAWFPKDSRAVLSISEPAGGGRPLPALLNVQTGEYNLIPEPFTNPGSLPDTRRTIVRAVQLGSFARVVNTGSCLNIRADATSTGEVLTCAADGVLLHANDETITDAQGAEWLTVTTPSGLQGWASTDYLER